MLGLIYSIVTPIFEAPDEVWHFNFARHVALGRGLPSLRDNDSGAYQEVGQPPLYYLVAGLVIAPFEPASTRAGWRCTIPALAIRRQAQSTTTRI